MSCMVDGDPSSRILIVGMAPGREELACDRPFMGGSGRLLWSLLKPAGIDRADCFILNTIGEWPEKADGNPSKEQYEKYWDDFDAAIGGSDARVIVCLGGAAFWRVSGLAGGIEAWRGYLVRPYECEPLSRTRAETSVYKTSNKKRGIKAGDPRIVNRKVSEKVSLPDHCDWILPTLHPAGVLRTGFASLPALAADLARAGRALRDTLAPCRITFIRDTPLIGFAKKIAVDIETPREGNWVIERVGVAYDAHTWSAPWTPASRDACAEMLSDPTRLCIVHNGGFDVPRLEAAGVPIRAQLYDTMLAAQMLQPDLYKGLKKVAPLYLDTQRWDHKASDDDAIYNATDVSRTWELEPVTRKLLDETGQLVLFEGTIMPTMRTLMDMTKRGLRVDEAKRETWLVALREKERKLLTEWQAMVGPVNPSSPKQLAKLLYQQWKLPAQWSKYGGPTADINALQALMRDGFVSPYYNELQTLLQYRQTAKMRATYAEHPVSGDGCMHPSYLPAGKDSDSGFGKGMAGTGRPTARDPNIQNQPLEARRLFIPHDAGLILLEADYSQIELRIAAALSDDPALLEALRGDVHARTMELLKCDRTRAKNVMYGTLYGAGPRKLAQVLRQKGFNISPAECEALQNALARAYPKLWAWRQDVVNRVAVDYWLSNPFGRRRYFLRGAGDAPAAIDFLPQSTAADIMWSVLKPVESALHELGGGLLATVHDSLLAEVPREAAATGAAAIRELMERPFEVVAPGFRVPTAMKIGENWGEMKEYALAMRV